MAVIEIYGGIFGGQRALNRLKAFASVNGPRFCGLPSDKKRTALAWRPWQVPEIVPSATRPPCPLFSGKEIAGRLRA